MKKLNKKEIKSYSNQILKICKLWGYNREDESFENFFDDGDDEAFYSIPCIRDGIDSCVDDEELEKFMEKLGKIVDEIILEANENDIEVEVPVEEVEAFVNENYDSFGLYIAEKADVDPEVIIDWIFDNCDKQTKEKFLKWVLE